MVSCKIDSCFDLWINTIQSFVALWESTACAAYLMNHKAYPVDEHLLYVETTSYDTISNAFFARSTMTDIVGWRKLLIVTNEFHIHRSKAIFDWIFNVPSIDASTYELYYLACNNVGLGIDALDSRRSHEARGESNVRSKLAAEYTTLQGVFEFLTTKHDFYTASKLVERASSPKQEHVRDKLLELSYGKPSLSENTNRVYSDAIELRGGTICASIIAFVALFIGFCLVAIRNTQSNNIRETSSKAN
ncbi:hypothetical protein HJC23_005285 [Cyclotella cryptica]|uniref:DUF218 domain-containing protein n=1 Tax=Cyclotella cryptica TaxID=29204 RepID=A0ABD3P4C7_9STRA